MLGQVTFFHVLSYRLLILYYLCRYIDVSLCTFGRLISIIKRHELKSENTATSQLGQHRDHNFLVQSLQMNLIQSFTRKIDRPCEIDRPWKPQTEYVFCIWKIRLLHMSASTKQKWSVFSFFCPVFL